MKFESISYTSREIVCKAIQFQHPPRLPRHIWYLPWAGMNHPEKVKHLEETYPSDIVFPPLDGVYQPSGRVKGDPFAIGTYVDEWGCAFDNIQAGVIGEVTQPMITAPEDWKQIQPPWETLPSNKTQARDVVNRFCGSTDKYVRTPCHPRLWERYQFLRSSEEALCDMADDDPEIDRMLKHIHDFYLAEMEFWASTDVDGLFIMDDWGSQLNLLIQPELWRTRFKPLYREYAAMAKASGKHLFMHSDGQIMDIYPDLIEIGIDALNSQLFCMDMTKLETIAKGKITFWGEIDRQHVLVSEDPEVGREAVRQVARHLYDPSGGIIIQFEYGPGAHYETLLAVLDEWEHVQQEPMQSR